MKLALAGRKGLNKWKRGNILNTEARLETVLIKVWCGPQFGRIKILGLLAGKRGTEKKNAREI